jgi:hypothetical protein
MPNGMSPNALSDKMITANGSEIGELNGVIVAGVVAQIGN